MPRWGVNKIIQILLVYLFLANVADALFVPMFSVFVTGWIEGATFSTIGFAIAIASVVKSICQVPLARALDKHPGELDDFGAMLVGALIVTVGAFLLLAVRRPIELYAVNIFLGLGSALLMAAYYALFAHHADKGAEIGRAHV